jgi:eukaryotic-like serine/threonine-protein kinase
MEYIPGQDLSARIRSGEPLPPEQLRPLVREIAAALDYAHEMGIVHRDVKPSNVMLCPVTHSGKNGSAFRAVLMDFGVVKLRSGAQTGLTGTAIVGTVDYIAPEQIRGEEVDGRADIYSLGVMAYEMCTGRKPFESSTLWNLLMAHIQRPAPDPRDVSPNLPATIALAIMRAMSKEPADRYPTAGAFAEALG